MDRHVADSTQGKYDQPATQLDEDRIEPMRLTPMMFIVPILVLTGLVAFGAVPRYLQHEALINHKLDQLSEHPSVSYVLAAPSPAVQEFILPGSTEAILTAPVFARVDGYLRVRDINIGDMVHKGQVLAEIDAPELDKQVQAADNSIVQAGANLVNAQEAYNKAQHDELTADANVKKAQSDLAYAKLEYVRYDELAKTGAVSYEDRDTRLTNYKGAAATLNSMEEAQRSAASQVKVTMASVKANQAAVQVSQSTRDQYAATQGFKVVKASFDGVVTQRNVDPGALITSGSTTANVNLFNIAKTDVLRIYAYVPEQYISLVHVGQTAGLTFQAYPDQVFDGTVTYVAGGLDPTSRTLQVEIHIPNQDRKLMPGMYAQVHFESPAKQHMAIVPSSAVQFIADGTFVYTVDNDNRVQMNKVGVYRDLGGRVEIQNGIKIGDKVMITPPDTITDGMQVNPVLQQPDHPKK